MSREPFHEIGELLRSHKPDPSPSPGLEARILRSLHPSQPTATGRIWPWFLLPPSVAAAMVLMWPQPATRPAITDPGDFPLLTASAVPDLLDQNPLERESIALQNDARRASTFLVNCLPGLAIPAE